MSKHYDVAVLGAGIGALTTAALLARRSWRVLVLGQGWRPPSYTFDGMTLARRPFTFLAGSSPAWSRVLVELAQSQSFRRRTTPIDPMFQVLAPRLRLEVPPDVQLFAKEIDRTYPEVRRVVDELYAELARTNAAADAAFERDVVWPPGTFWERRETGPVAATMPRFADDPGARSAPRTPPLLAEFPRDHDFRCIVDVPTRFASRAADLPEFAIARLHGAWTRGVQRLEGGEAELIDFLVDRVRAHGGDVQLSQRASRIAQKRGRATGVVLDGDDDPTGVGFVVSDHTTRSILDLTSEFDPPQRALASLPHLIAAEWRFVMSIVVRDEGLPDALGHESFLLSSWPHRDPDPRRPLVHLQRWRHRTLPGSPQRLDPLRGAPSFAPTADPTADGPLPSQPFTGASAFGDVPLSTFAPLGVCVPGASLLIAEAAFPEASSLPIARAREVVLGVIESLLPFVERHYLVIDSPHDGRPLWDFRSGTRRDVDRAGLRAGGASLEPEPMNARWRVDPPRFHGLGGEPLRTPLAGAFVVGPSTLPVLGQEGELLAAWSAARLITRTDRRKERIRREMWRKIELG